MISVITFVISAFALWIYGFFYEIEFEMVFVFSLLISIAVSLPYYYHKISKDLAEINEKLEKDEKKQNDTEN